MDEEAPTRVNYRSGQFLDAADFRDEQDYHRGRHQRLSRLAIGSGVLCGLEVSATGTGQIVVEPGIAIDPLGREIVLPTAHTVADPFQPTDDQGRPSGAPAADGPVTLFLGYAETGREARSGVRDSSDRDDPLADRIVETFHIIVRAGEPPFEPGLSAAPADAIPPAATRRGFDGRVALYDAPDRSGRAPDGVGVVLASISHSPSGGAAVVDQGGRRRDLYSSAQLLDLVLGLADRLTAVEQAPGDTSNQAAPGRRPVQRPFPGSTDR